MIAVQLELTPAEAPSDAETQARREFLLALADGEWHTAASLGARSEQEKRVLRAFAGELAGEVISCDLGYKLRRIATEADWDQAIRRRKSQIDRMTQVYVELLRARHMAIHGPTAPALHSDS